MISLIKKIVVFFSLISVGLLLSVISILWIYSNKLPDYKYLKSYKPPVSSKLYAGDGILVSDFSAEKRIFIPYDSIPKVVVDSFLSAEDKNFFKHPGVDAKGVIRAFKNNVFNLINSKRLEGASTITQQVAKNFLLNNEVSIDRKVKEAILAFRIERALSKERILELYLNQIYLGEGSYGIASASLRYFDKSINELNYPEAALLAALPKAPSKYNPYKNMELAKFRRNLVLKNLLDNSYIDKNQFNEIIKSEIKLKKRKRIFFENSRYFVEEVRKKVINDYGFDKVYKQGFNIKTPIDLNLQNLATKALRQGLESYDKRRGWRGPLLNRKINNEWGKGLEKFNLEKSLGWEIAIVKRETRGDINTDLSNLDETPLNVLPEGNQGLNRVVNQLGLDDVTDIDMKEFSKLSLSDQMSQLEKRSGMNIDEIQQLLQASDIDLQTILDMIE